MNQEEKVSLLRNLINQTKGNIFEVWFKKRTNGEMRHMIASTNVSSHLVGGYLKFNPKDYNLFIVLDVEKDAIRSIPLDAVTKLQTEETIFNE